MPIVLDRETANQLELILGKKVNDPILIARALGDDPATCFAYTDVSGTDFSASDVAGISWEGAILDNCTFRKGDLSPEARAQAHSCDNITEV